MRTRRAGLTICYSSRKSKGVMKRMKYVVSLTTKLKPPQSGTIVIEPEDYTAAEIQALRKSGARVLGYLSVGSVSDERSYYKQLEPYTLRKLDDWPHERYLDVRAAYVRTWLQQKARELKKKGVDGYWLDNIDVYEEYRTTEMFQAIVNTLHAIKAVGGYVMINGGMLFITDMLIPHKVQLGAYKRESNAKRMCAALKRAGLKNTIVEMDGLYKVQAGAYIQQDSADRLVKMLKSAGFTTAKRITLFAGKPRAYLDGVTQEEVFSRITDYDGKGTFGKQHHTESERYQAHMRRVVKAGLGGWLLEYTVDTALKNKILTFCKTSGMSGACISADVDL